MLLHKGRFKTRKGNEYLLSSEDVEEKNSEGDEDTEDKEVLSTSDDEDEMYDDANILVDALRKLWSHRHKNSAKKVIKVLLEEIRKMGLLD